jgi:hypothetical protein
MLRLVLRKLLRVLTTLLTGALTGLLSASLHTVVASEISGHFPVRHLPYAQLEAENAAANFAQN